MPPVELRLQCKHEQHESRDRRRRISTSSDGPIHGQRNAGMKHGIAEMSGDRGKIAAKPARQIAEEPGIASGAKHARILVTRAEYGVHNE